MRGSPHEHMFLWLENAPIYDQNNDEYVISFIDKYITCHFYPNDAFKNIGILKYVIKGEKIKTNVVLIFLGQLCLKQ